MKKAFLILAKLAVFIIFLMNVGVWFPFYHFIRRNIHHVMSLDTATNITDIIGGYPEPWDFMAIAIVLFLNTIISIILCKLTFMLVRHIRKKMNKSD
ncbi:hypothetical protein HF675_21310 [Serratia sp. JUb9]|uniref:hypothetical protein n=1 Tax=unclassified Serratia (in: enterobacteria) TaxID=2647522 RepID=UPI00164D4074|nr:MULTISPECIES: hypothetical protein [unclassified Serratia (in: enterobacteria)]QNK32077.1 hypothetical protein HF675_21310 [Serratia sp. JUb9]